MKHSKAPSAMEDKSARFERLAERRVSEAIKKLRLIGNLSNRNNYDYDGVQSKQILDALDEELKNLKLRFRGAAGSEEVRFQFRAK